MKNDWILDVLADLTAFATENEMGALAEQLDVTRLLAAAELASATKGQRRHDGCSAIAAGPLAERVGRRH